MTKPARGRFIVSDPMTPADNMALDQALLESMDRTGSQSSQTEHVESQPAVCLRFYSWAVPTLSLGYFQAYQERDSHAASQSAVCVRRSSGGGAILHDREVTYSLIVRHENARRGADAGLYTTVHHAIAESLADFGVTALPHRQTAKAATQRIANHAGESVTSTEPFLCFQRRTDEDLIVSGYKVLGSAQRRGRSSLLQHGSLLVKASQFAPELPGILDLGANAGSSACYQRELHEPIAARLAAALGVHWEPSQVSELEQSESSRIATERFANDRWLHRR